MARAFFHLFFLILLLSYSGMEFTANARPLGISSATTNLLARLKLDKESPTSCWDSLIQLQACTGEFILFFLNGETYLGHGCCEAITVITKQCWPNMIDTLGFTTEEGDILEGYCDKEGETDHHDRGDSLPSSASLGPNGVKAIVHRGTIVP